MNAAAIDRLTGGLGHLFGSWRFPVLVLSVLFFFMVGITGILLIPTSSPSMGAFAEDFRIWCFGYDPATGRMQVMRVVLFYGDPLLLAAMVAGFWWSPLRAVLDTRRSATVPWVASGALLVVAALAGFSLLRTAPRDGAMAFPAESLRTHVPPPQFSLVDQARSQVTLGGLRGQVVILTGVYAHCPHTCPIILQQVKAALSELTAEERDDVRVVAVTLDPEVDTPEVLAELAAAHGLASPPYHLLSGDPTVVNGVLDQLGIERRVDERTGVIDHTNLFAVVDRSGEIAYRFTLGERQERWLVSAIRALLAEPSPNHSPGRG